MTRKDLESDEKQLTACLVISLAFVVIEIGMAIWPGKGGTSDQSHGRLAIAIFGFAALSAAYRVATIRAERKRDELSDWRLGFRRERPRERGLLPRPRFTIRWLLGLITFSGVGFAACRHPLGRALTLSAVCAIGLVWMIRAMD